MRSMLVLAALAATLAPPPARADTHGTIHQAFAVLEAWTDHLADEAQGAIILGGTVIDRNRYTISGGIVGCTLGLVAGAGSAAVLALPTGGASVAAAPDAMAAGCVAGAVGGAAFGYTLDHAGAP